MNQRNNLLIVIGGALVIFVIVFLSLHAATSTATTVVAARPIAAGTRLSAEDLTTQSINTNSRLAGALNKAPDAVGKVVLIARGPGDQITLDQVSDQAGVGIPAQLDPGTVAIGIHVNQASGLAGAIREGDRVTIIAVVDPQNLGGDFTAAPPIVAIPPSGAPRLDSTPVPTPIPQTAAARLTVSGLKVLLVPQAFRYEEVPQDQTGQLSPVRSSTAAQQSSVILLQAPVEPVEVAPGLEMSPAELLALLDEKATIHLVLEPRDGLTGTRTAIGVQLADVYGLLIGVAAPTPTPTPAPVGTTR